MRRVGKRQTRSASPCGSSLVHPRRQSANLFQDDDELFFLGHQLGYLPSSWRLRSHALPKVDTSHPQPCVVCVFQLEVLTYTFLRSQKKKTTILTYHHSVHKAKVCFGMGFFCPPQRSTKRFFDVETNQRDVERNGTFSISNFRRSISASSCSLSLSAYRGGFVTIQAHLYVGF